MSEESTLETLIETEAAEAQSQTADGMSVTRRSIKDLIEADKYLKQQEAATNKPARMGLRMGVFRAPEHY
jgi:hypothetical protein